MAIIVALLLGGQSVKPVEIMNATKTTIQAVRK